MNCQEAQTQLSEYLESSLDALRMKSIETHLLGCPVCRAEADGLADCIQEIARLPIVDPRSNRVLGRGYSRRSDSPCRCKLAPLS